jgi:hypothetical protein
MDLTGVVTIILAVAQLFCWHPSNYGTKHPPTCGRHTSSADDGAADDAGGGVAAGFAPCAAGAPAAVPDPGDAGFAADPSLA